MKLRLIKTVIVKLVWFAVFALPLLDNCRLRQENETLKRDNVELRLKTGNCVKNKEIKHHHEQMDATLKRANERLEKYETRCSEMVAEKYRLLDDNINQLHARMNHLQEAMVVTEQIDDQQHYCPDYNYTSLEDRLHRAMHHLKRQKSSQLLAENRLKETTEMIVAERIAGLDLRPVYQRHPDFTSDACGARIVASNGGIDVPGAIFGRVSLSHLPLQHNLQPGACWPCKVPDCLLRIKLCRPITPTALVIHHIPPDISPSPHGIASAPRDLTVRMGASSYELRYEANNAPSQTFQLEHAPHLIDELELRILSSWFHPDGIACLYKIQLY